MPAREYENILVALNRLSDTDALLKAVIELAMQSNSGITGLFVEDINLIRSAGFPRAREVRASMRGGRTFCSEDIVLKLRAQARLLQQTLYRACVEFSIQNQFQITRGLIEEQILLAEQEADLLVLGWPASGMKKSIASGVTTNQILAKSKKPVLIIPPGSITGESIYLVYDGSPGSEKTLLRTKRFAEIFKKHVVVLQIGDKAPTVEPGETVHYDLIWMSKGWYGLMEYLSSRKEGILIFTKGDGERYTENMPLILENLRIPLLFLGE